MCNTIVTGCHIIIINVLRRPSCIAEPRHHHLAVTLLRFCCPTRNSWQSQQDYGLMLNKLHAGTHSRVTLFGSNKSDFAPKMYSDLINFRCVRLCDVCLNCYPNCKSVRTKTVHNSQFALIFAETQILVMKTHIFCRLSAIVVLLIGSLEAACFIYRVKTGGCCISYSVIFLPQQCIICAE